jgi:hypothetical protein
MVTVPTPGNWDKIVAFTESPRNTFNEIRKARPDQEMVKKILLDYLEGCKFSKCEENKGYIKAMGVQNPPH